MPEKVKRGGRRTGVGCHKVSYPDRKLAKMAIKIMRSKLGYIETPGMKLGVYICERCGGIHIGNSRF